MCMDFCQCPGQSLRKCFFGIPATTPKLSSSSLSVRVGYREAVHAMGESTVTCAQLAASCTKRKAAQMESSVKSSCTEHVCWTVQTKRVLRLPMIPVHIFNKCINLFCTFWYAYAHLLPMWMPPYIVDRVVMHNTELALEKLRKSKLHNSLLHCASGAIWCLRYQQLCQSGEQIQHFTHTYPPQYNILQVTNMP